MNTMNIPGFNAEASLYNTTRHYSIAGVIESATEAIRLAQFDEEPVPDLPFSRTIQCRNGTGTCICDPRVCNGVIAYCDGNGNPRCFFFRRR